MYVQNKIKKLRIGRGVSQKAVCNHLKITPATMRGYEKMERVMPSKVMEDYLGFLGYELRILVKSLLIVSVLASCSAPKSVYKELMKPDTQWYAKIDSVDSKYIYTNNGKIRKDTMPDTLKGFMVVKEEFRFGRY